MKQLIGGVLVLGLFGVAAAQAPPAANTPPPVLGNTRPMQPTNGVPTTPNPATGRAPPTPRPGLLVARGPSFDLALEAAKAAQASCAGLHIGVAVLDSAGLPKLYYIPDGSSGFHAYMAFRKANTALLVKAPSEEILNRIKTDPAMAAKVAASDNYISFAGGLPIMVNGEVIGAIAVSGAGPSEIDKKCATDGLKAIQDRLK